jgi:prolipoprotein diacylglyceryltransferase
VNLQVWWQLPWIPAILSGLLIVWGALGGGYYFWKKAREEHFNLWETFDGLILSAIAAFVASRLAYVLLRGEWIILIPKNFIQIWNYPGLWAPAGLIAAFVMMGWSARKMKREIFEIWDFYALILAWFLGWYWLSRLLIGAAAGISTQLPIGVLFPQRVEPAHPIQIYASIGYLLLFRYLWWAEPKYRFFLWYRSKKRTAKSGFLFSVFAIATGIIGVLIGFVDYPFLRVLDFDINQLFYAILFLFGCVVLYVRSGQLFFVKKEKEKNEAPFISSNPGA